MGFVRQGKAWGFLPPELYEEGKVSGSNWTPCSVRRGVLACQLPAPHNTSLHSSPHPTMAQEL